MLNLIFYGYEGVKKFLCTRTAKLNEIIDNLGTLNEIDNSHQILENI